MHTPLRWRHLVALFAIAAALMAVFGISSARAATTRTVCASCTYTTIQAAINAASSGDTISVLAGTYDESLSISIPLTLQSSSGAASTIINGGDPYSVFITSKDVTVDGFTITNPGYTGASDAAGIVVDPDPYGTNAGVRITNNLIHDIGSPGRTSVAYGNCGINIGFADGVEIDHNEIYNIIHNDPVAWANGVCIWGGGPSTPADHITIHDNSFHDISSPYPADAAISTQTDVGSVTVYTNSIVSTLDHPTEYGVEVRSTNTVDATNNWWGSAAGPGSLTNVTTTPWATDSGFTTQSGNAHLTALSFSSGILSPAFNPSTTAYTASVGNDVTSVTAATTTTPGANAVVSGGSSLAVGTNTVTVTVTSADRSATKTYTIAVTRVLPNNADLTSLSLSGGTLIPAFNPSTTAYTASVDNIVEHVSVTTTTNPGASAVVNGGSNLSVGTNTVTITVTAADGTTTRTYTVTVTRAVCAILLSSVTRTTLPSGHLRLVQRLRFNGIGRHTLIFIDPRTGKRVTQLPDSTVGKRKLRRRFSAPVVVLSKPGTNLVLVSLFGKNLPASVKKAVRLRIIMRDPDGTLSDVTP